MSALIIGYFVVGVISGLVAGACDGDDEPLGAGVTFLVTAILWPVFVGEMGLAAVAWVIGKAIQMLKKMK